jgi:predicted enzyme related to lactoylglutathione lyase
MEEEVLIMATATNVGITGIDATYYTTKDLGKATEFYTQLFGFEPTMHVPDTVSEWTLQNDTTFGLYQPHDSSNWHPSGGVLFHVDDLKAAVDAGKTLGAAFDDRQEETPMCSMAFGRDPEGNNFILHQLR